MKIVNPLCLELPGKETYMSRPEGGAVEIDWQLLSPVTTDLKRSSLKHFECLSVKFVDLDMAFGIRSKFW